MAIVFPASPSVNETFTSGSITYKWDGDKWIGLGVTPADRLIEGSNSLEITAGNDLVWTGDNVGIKTTDPQSALEVVDNISFTSGDTMPQLRIKATSGAVGKVMNLGLNETDDYGLIQTMDRGTGYSTALILQPYGTARVGIGAEFPDPDAKLEVRDSSAQGVIIRATNTQATDTNKALRIRNNSDVDTASISHRGNGYFAGNVQFASGSGIDFSANGNAAGMTSEVLDDYEEGTWTPEVRDNFSVGNLGSQDLAEGYYTKVGNKVDVWGRLSNIDTTGMNSSFDFCMAGLPFTATSNTTIVSGDVTTNFVTFAGELGVRLEGARSSIRLHETASGGNNDFVTISQISSGTADVFMHITYFVD